MRHTARGQMVSSTAGENEIMNRMRWRNRQQDRASDSTIPGPGWLIFAAAVVLASGWVGAGFNLVVGEEHGMESPGTLIWLVTPLLTVVALRLTRRVVSPGGWRLRLGREWPWYLVALAVYPLLVGVVIIAGVITGSGSIANLQLFALGGTFFAAVGPALVKNVFEEAVWRGYFVGELTSCRVNDLAVYLISGLIWGLWHVPYYLFFLPESDLREVFDVPRAAFAALATVVMVLWGVFFAELFRLTGSIWPVVVLHAVEDASINPLVIDGHFRITEGYEWLVSPIIGIVPALLLAIAGLGLRSVRLRRTRKDPG